MSVTETAAAPAPETEDRPDRLPVELLASDLFLLSKLGLLVKSSALAAFDAVGFEAHQYSLLALLDEGDRATQATIADVLGVDRSQLVGILDVLEERRLIERRRDPHDRRRHVVSLTPAGRKQLARLRAIISRLDEAFFAGIDAADREVLHRVLLELAGRHDVRCSA